MSNNREILLKKIINLSKSGESKYKLGDFKGAIDDKRKAKSLLDESLDRKLLEKYKDEISNLYISKFDLISDHKLRIDSTKKAAIIKLLEQKSEDKYNKGDYKGAIKAFRRSEKYI
tara:strand:- start:338 stop:685 length:348 start_codon:yes stop_codon:yes gene_type:complete